ncbi:cytochrome c biogenesis protein ResB [Ideonella livida]|uniref:Cytochrome c biogenesis protein ResB n=1 Tax=Ideonella livida TaxID=2707176 RepID=A0A7C9TIN3_9BURK|nr:cytochrome c biogenesis protein ResB [Ideonella livida]NDY91198.1 cytochrome c biogenesis protein ResB [Ideonella livida]
MSSAAPGLPSSPARRTRWPQAWMELLSSMRFAIALLSVICIASIIGTVIQQGQPYNNYINQFGPFWAEVFERAGLFAIYSSPWFLLILGFLVISTSLCIARNTPKILQDLRSFKEHVQERSLRAFHHHAEAELPASRDQVIGRIAAALASKGWQARVQERAGQGTMVAARAGRANKLGYLAAHGAIVLICLGGLFDGDLVVRAQLWFGGKEVYTGGGFIKDVPAQHRLSTANPTYRGNLQVPEGGRSGTAILALNDGVVLQDLPFEVELRKFIVEYYDTGMPKLFASEVVVHDRDTGQRHEATIKVNEPFIHRGVAIYQSSFDDGGSEVRLRGLPLSRGGEPFEVGGVVGGSSRLTRGTETLTLELTGLKVINVENLGAGATEATDVRAVNLGSALDKHLGSGAKGDKAKTMRNVGPAITYKLRDAAGQAREYHSYMAPMVLEDGGAPVFLVGARETPAEAFRYLRIPADEQGGLQGWQRLRVALQDAALREKAATRYAALATPPGKPEMAEQLRVTGLRTLGLFAGLEAATSDKPAPGGLAALSQFIDASVPTDDRERVAEVLLRILNGNLFELNQLAREQAGLPPLATDEGARQFMTQAVLALSDSFFYPAPFLLMLEDFKQVQASVFQVTRSPGKNLVYLGAVLLIIGVFAMLYVRERRLWIWLAPAVTEPAAAGGDPSAGAGSTRVLMALSTPRKLRDADLEFETLRQAVLGPTPTGAPGDTTR